MHITKTVNYYAKQLTRQTMKQHDDFKEQYKFFTPLKLCVECGNQVQRSIIPYERQLPHICSPRCANRLLVHASYAPKNHVICTIAANMYHIDCANQECNKIIDLPDSRVAYLHWNNHLMFCSSSCCRRDRKRHAKNKFLYSM